MKEKWKQKHCSDLGRSLLGICVVLMLFGSITRCTPGTDALNKYNCSIINVDVSSTQKKSINVRIPRKLNVQELTEIAKYLRKKNAVYTRLFICYYLPEMQVGNGAFATTHFNPDLKVAFGTESEFIKSEVSLILKAETGLKIIGTWYDNSLGAQVIYQIYHKNNQYILRRIIGDLFTEEKLRYTNKNGIKKFAYDDDNDTEYFIINSSGKLDIYDEVGFILSCPKKDY